MAAILFFRAQWNNYYNLLTDSRLQSLLAGKQQPIPVSNNIIPATEGFLLALHEKFQGRKSSWRGRK